MSTWSHSLPLACHKLHTPKTMRRCAAWAELHAADWEVPEGEARICTWRSNAPPTFSSYGGTSVVNRPHLTSMVNMPDVERYRSTGLLKISYMSQLTQPRGRRSVVTSVLGSTSLSCDFGLAILHGSICSAPKLCNWNYGIILKCHIPLSAPIPLFLSFRVC